MSFIRIGSPAVVSMAQLTAPLYEHIRSSVHLRVALASSPSDLRCLYQLAIQTSSHPRKNRAACCVLLLRGCFNGPTYIWSFCLDKEAFVTRVTKNLNIPYSIHQAAESAVASCAMSGGYDPLQASPLLMYPLFFVDFLRDHFRPGVSMHCTLT